MSKKTDEPSPYPTEKVTVGVLEVCVGDVARDYRGGDFLNALDELASWFLNETDLSSDHIAALLDVYAAELRR